MCFLLEMFDRAHQFLQQPRLHVQNQQSWLLIHPHNSEQRIIAPPQDPLALGFSCSPNSSNANCVLTKFNFVNNSDSSGYFSLCSGNHKRLKESIIAIKSTGILRWVWSTAQVSIEGSFIVHWVPSMEEGRSHSQQEPPPLPPTQPTHPSSRVQIIRNASVLQRATQ